MNQTDMTGRDIVFGRIYHHHDLNTELETLGKLRLEADGRIAGSGHENETRWELCDGQLSFLNTRGELTTRFDTIESVGEASVVTGACLIDFRETRVRHFLSAYVPFEDDVLKMRFIVPTMAGYGVPLAHCLTQLEAAGVPKAQIRVTVAASPEAEVVDRNGIRFSHLRENAYEYTGLIDVARHETLCDYVFLLHDTCQVGPAFLDLIRLQSKSVRFDYMSVAAGSVHNIGIYSVAFLRSIRPFLEALNGMSKSEGIAVEHNRDGKGFKGQSRVTTNFLDGRRSFTGRHTPYGSSNVRNGIRLPGADLHKYYFHFAGRHPEEP